MPIKFGTLNLSKIMFGTKEVVKVSFGSNVIYEKSASVDPVLNNNSWAVIAQVCNAGEAANYWALGDTKTDLGTDGVTRTFRICDMSGMYGKNVVFEQVELTESGIVWNASSNTDNNGCSNNYNISNVRNTAIPALLANYSLDLQAVITNTTYKVAKNGTANPMVLLDLTDKLFLPAEREIFASRSLSVQEEFDALTRFALYALPENDNATFRIKKDPTNTAQSYWERSPRAGNNVRVCYVLDSGNGDFTASSNSNRIAPVFALGVAPTPAVDPILENNSWETIKAVCEEGKAADYWNVGDTKNVTAGGYTRPVMIVDMSHGRTVFMFRNCTEQGYTLQPTGIGGIYNNYSVSQMRTTHLASGGGVRTALLDADLRAALTASSYKVATNGNDGTLLTLSDELWLPAEKELTQTRSRSRQDEFDALTTFDYFVANDNNNARRCPKASAPTSTNTICWQRSPQGGDTSNTCIVNGSGGLGSLGAWTDYSVFPCFAFTPTN